LRTPRSFLLENKMMFNLKREMSDKQKRQREIVWHYCSLFGGGSVLGSYIYGWTGAGIGAIVGCLLAMYTVSKWGK
jgi:hypothetical protein